MHNISSHSAWLSQVLCRHVTQEDLPALEWEGEYLHFRRLYQEVYHSTCQGKALMWVAELPEVDIIGQVFVQLLSARTELADGHTRAYVYGFRVKPTYRDMGVGARLLHAVEDDLRQRRFRQITLNVGRDNSDARRFYERHGYQVVASETGRWSYEDHLGNQRQVHEPAWRMQKRIA